MGINVGKTVWASHRHAPYLSVGFSYLLSLSAVRYSVANVSVPVKCVSLAFSQSCWVSVWMDLLVIFMSADTSFPAGSSCWCILCLFDEAQHICLMSCVCSFNTHLTGWQEFYGSAPHNHLLQYASDIIYIYFYLILNLTKNWLQLHCSEFIYLFENY